MTESIFDGVVCTASGWSVDTLLRYRDDIRMPRKSSREWSDGDRERFIESLELGLPVPMIVLACGTHERERWRVVDGMSRLKAIFAFHDGLSASRDRFCDRHRRLLERRLDVCVVGDREHGKAQGEPWDLVIDEIYRRLNMLPPSRSRWRKEKG